MPLLAALCLAVSAGAVPAWVEKPSQARAEAKKAGKPLLIDFHAPWCYSCYYMEERVLGRPAFEKAARGLVLLKADVDRAEGRALKEARRVSFLPTYIVESPAGKELGRIVGEQSEADFLARLESLLKGGARSERADAFESLRATLSSPDRGEALRALRKMIELGGACDFPGDLSSAEGLVDRLPERERRDLLESERKALESLLEKRYLVEPSKRCADFRTGVATLAGVYEKLGFPDERARLLSKAVARLKDDGLITGDDRNQDDNLRYFLELAGDEAGLKAHFEALLAAYPADYVYPYRYARYLADKGRFAEAEPWSAKAWGLSYGANRLAVAKVRAKVLAGLGRKDEAKALLKRELKAGKKAFPKEAAQLQEALSAL